MKKSFSFLAVILAMTLAACGGNTGNSKSSAAESSINSRPSSSRAPTPVVSVSSTDVTAKDGKVYLQITGMARNFTPENFKWALALQHIGNQSLDPLDTYILGGATFADTDYNVPVTIAENNSFTFEYCLSDIPGLEPGMYAITAGPKNYLVDVGSVTTGLNAKDSAYRYYLRHDEEVNDTNTLVIDALPPITFAEASVEKIDNVIYAKVGGSLKAGITQEILDGYNSFVQFQQVGGSWTNTRRTKANNQFYYRVENEGAKAYIYIDISFFAADTNYNTHINVTENKQADCKMDVALDAHYIYANASGTLLDINVYANPTAASDDSNEFWGNLGFKVVAASDGAQEGPVTPAA